MESPLRRQALVRFESCLFEVTTNSGSGRLTAGDAGWKAMPHGIKFCEKHGLLPADSGRPTDWFQKESAGLLESVGNHKS